MNLLARIESAPRDLPMPLPAGEPCLLRFPPQPARVAEAQASAPTPAEAAALSLLDREERILILLSRTRSRLSGLAGSWAAAAERHLPAPSAESAEARSRKARLAALVRYAILYRLDRGGLAFEEDERLARAGYSDAQAEAVRALVHRFDLGWSPTRGGWGKSAGFLALAAGGTFLLQRWFAAGVDDSLLAWLLAIVLATATASIIAVTAHPGGPGGYRAR
jgi:hypothetical protein